MMFSNIHFLLDFDNVIFDTDKFKEHLQTYRMPEAERHENMIEVIENGVSLETLETLLYPDARAFLQIYGSMCSVVSTSMSRDPSQNTKDNISQHHAFQVEKIKRSGVSALVHATYVVDSGKREILQQLQKEYIHKNELLLFVDDSADFIAQGRNIGVASIRMCRDAETVLDTPDHQDTTYPIVHTFDDLVTYVQQQYPQHIV